MKNGIILILAILTYTKAETMIPTLLSQTNSASKKASQSHHTLTGKIRLNGFEWETTCDCSPDKSNSDKARCNPSNLKIFRDKSGNGLTFGEVRKYMGEIKSYSWSKISKSSFTCVDGRVDNEALSTPGGDAGEFLLALHTYQNYFGTKMKLNDVAVDRIFRRYLDHMEQNKFTMCTDDIAVEHIEKQLSVSCWLTS